MNNTSVQGKVGELSEDYFRSGKSRGIQCKIPQVGEKSGERIEKYLKSVKSRGTE